MPLDPQSLITDAEQDSIYADLNTAKGHRVSLQAAIDTLDRFLRDRAPADIGMMIDLWADGEVKPADQVKRLGGRRPKILSEKLNEQKVNGAHPPDTYPPAASQGIIAQAIALQANMVRAEKRYNVSGQLFDDHHNRLSRRVLCAKDECIDVFDTGLLKLVIACYWPEPLEMRRERLVKL